MGKTDSQSKANEFLFSEHSSREGEARRAWLAEGATQAPLTALLGLDRYCFIYEHYRDVIFYRVHEFAGITDESVLGFCEPDIPFAFRATEYVQQFFADWHNTSPYVLASWLSLLMAGSSISPRVEKAVSSRGAASSLGFSSAFFNALILKPILLSFSSMLRIIT